MAASLSTCLLYELQSRSPCRDVWSLWLPNRHDGCFIERSLLPSRRPIRGPGYGWPVHTQRQEAGISHSADHSDFFGGLIHQSSDTAKIAAAWCRLLTSLA
ncbi:hypothetical protein GOODEAATRI_007724 [Goodea atripinnis]|uniref:Uncharacterized protein n=1 Tax=Goodea atripinnis TaxID=208336 RepID=A0ABV0MQM5_9TELE